jgi:hypothetical protein
MSIGKKAVILDFGNAFLGMGNGGFMSARHFYAGPVGERGRPSRRVRRFQSGREADDVTFI